MKEGVNSNMIYLIYFKSFCKCHKVSLPNTRINKRILLPAINIPHWQRKIQIENEIMEKEIPSKWRLKANRGSYTYI
jgi:hypothetical protein